MALNPTKFYAPMTRWNVVSHCEVSQALAGLPNEAFRGIDTPERIVAGKGDVHTPAVSNAVAQPVPRARCIPSPLFNKQWLDMFTERKPCGSIRALYPLLAAALLPIIERRP